MNTLPSEKGFPNIDDFMAQARQNVAAQADRRLEVEMNIARPAPTPNDPDVEERLDAANILASRMITEIKTQLATPPIAPKGLTPAEASEKAAADKWDGSYTQTDKLTTRMEQGNDLLFQQVIGLIDGCEEDWVVIEEAVNVPLPPPSPKLEWLKDVPSEVRKWVAASKQPTHEDEESRLSVKHHGFSKSNQEARLNPTTNLRKSAGMFMKRMLGVKDSLMTGAIGQQPSRQNRPAKDLRTEEMPDWVKREWDVLGSYDKTHKW